MRRADQQIGRLIQRNLTYFIVCASNPRVTIR
jgi:hypothetical protein